MVTSEQGRKMLAGEVEALTARQERRAKQESGQGKVGQEGPGTGRTSEMHRIN